MPDELPPGFHSVQQLIEAWAHQRTQIEALDRRLALAEATNKELTRALGDIAQYGAKNTGHGFSCAKMANDALAGKAR